MHPLVSCMDSFLDGLKFLDDTPSVEQRDWLLISRSAIDFSERPMAVVGQTPSGKSRLDRCGTGTMWRASAQ